MDIFGRNQSDYTYLQAVKDSGVDPKEYLRSSASSKWGTNSKTHNFAALNEGSLYTAFEGSAQVVGFVTNNLQAIQSMIDEILYTEYRLPEFIPVITDVPEGATTYAYKVVDRVGLGRFIDNSGDEAPSANVGVRLVPYVLQYAGIVAEWTVEDLRRAMFSGIPLDSETIEAATTGAMDHIETVGLSGDTTRGFQGLINQNAARAPNANQVPLINESVPDFDTAGSDALLTFLQAQTADFIDDSKEVFGRTLKSGFTLYMPIAQAAVIRHKRIPDLNMNVWDYYRANNAWTHYTGEEPTLKWLAELDGAGSVVSSTSTGVSPSGTATDRMILGVNNTRVMEMAMPITPRVLTVQDKGYTVCAPLEYKVSGLNVKRTQGLRYIDGI